MGRVSFAQLLLNNLPVHVWSRSYDIIRGTASGQFCTNSKDICTLKLNIEKNNDFLDYLRPGEAGVTRLEIPLTFSSSPKVKVGSKTLVDLCAIFGAYRGLSGS